MTKLLISFSLYPFVSIFFVFLNIACISLVIVNHLLSVLHVYAHQENRTSVLYVLHSQFRKWCVILSCVKLYYKSG